MVEEKKGEKGGFWNGILNILDSGVVARTARSIMDNFMESVEHSADKTIQKAIKYLGIYLLLFAGIVFLVLSPIFLLNQYGILSYGWSFMIMGLILLVLAMTLKANIR